MPSLLQEHRSISRFIGYALCATNEALRGAKWIPTEQVEKEKTVIVYFSPDNEVRKLFLRKVGFIFSNLKAVRVSPLVGELEALVIYWMRRK